MNEPPPLGTPLIELRWEGSLTELHLSGSSNESLVKNG